MLSKDKASDLSHNSFGTLESKSNIEFIPMCLSNESVLGPTPFKEPTLIERSSGSLCMIYSLKITASISTSTSFGNLLTSTAARDGYGLDKYFSITLLTDEKFSRSLR